MRTRDPGRGRAVFRLLSCFTLESVGELVRAVSEVVNNRLGGRDYRFLIIRDRP